MPIYDDNLIQSTIGSLYQVPDFQIGNYSFAQILDYLPGFGPDESWNVVKLVLMVVSILLGGLLVIVIVKMNKLNNKIIDECKDKNKLKIIMDFMIFLESGASEQETCLKIQEYKDLKLIELFTELNNFFRINNF